MNIIKLLPLFTLVCSVSTFAAGQKSIRQSYLYGNWNCKHEIEEPNTKMKVNINYHINYASNGLSNGFGAISFNLPGMPELEYSLADNSSWKIKDGYLLLSSTDIKLVSVSHPELEKFLNLKQFFPQSVNESTEIVELTKTNLKVKSQSYGGIYTCAKVAIKN